MLIGGCRRRRAVALSLASLLAGALATGCASTPPLPPVSSAKVSPDLATVAIGATLPPLRSSYVKDGQRVDATWTPRVEALLLQMPSVGLAASASEACAVEGQLSLARSGGALRCGRSDAAGEGSVGVSAGLSWLYAEGVTQRTAVEAGYRSGGWFVFASTGVSGTAAYGRTFRLAQDCIECVLAVTTPRGPLLVASQLELASSSTLAIGLPPVGTSSRRGARGDSLFMGVSLDVPFLHTAGSFRTSDPDSHVYTDLRPGIRVGVVIGYSALRSSFW